MDPGVAVAAAELEAVEVGHRAVVEERELEPAIPVLAPEDDAHVVLVAVGAARGVPGQAQAAVDLGLLPVVESEQLHGDKPLPVAARLLAVRVAACLHAEEPIHVGGDGDRGQGQERGLDLGHAVERPHDLVHVHAVVGGARPLEVVPARVGVVVGVVRLHGHIVEEEVGLRVDVGGGQAGLEGGGAQDGGARDVHGGARPGTWVPLARVGVEQSVV